MIKLLNSPYLRSIFILAIATLCFTLYSSRPATPAPSASTWSDVLNNSRIEFKALEKQVDVTQKEAFIENFSKTYPVLTDWLKQDQPENWQAYFNEESEMENDVARIEKVMEEISAKGGHTKDLKKQLKKLKKAADTDALTNLYVNACERRRKMRLDSFLSTHSDIVFAQHHNFKMSFIGYTEGLSDARHERFFKPGAKLSRLSFDGLYGKVEPLIDDPHGMIRDVDVSKDGKHALFAWKKSDRLDDYHIYQYDLSSGEIQQLTDGLGRADYEPTYLPDGDIIFTSTRPEQSVPCWWTEISNLYRMNDQGQYIRRLAVDQVHTLYPSVLENGRIIYTRWDYSDRGQNYPHPLFNMNPDGTDQRVFYGGNSWFPTSLLHARAIPGSHKVMAIAAGHHTRQHGKLVVLDVNEGRDEGKGMHFVAPRREVDYERVDVAQQHGDQFRYPYPLNENEFLVTYMPEDKDLIDHEKWNKYKYMDDAVYGLYWMDMDGNRELLFNDGEIPVGRPVPLKKPNKPLVVADTVDYSQQTGLYYVHDVYEGVGLEGIERGTAKKIRVVRLNYRAAGVGKSRNEGEGGGSLNSGPVGVGNVSWDIKEILGDVDIHEDGSALFEVPAMESIYLQVLDKQGRVVQTTRSWDTVRPGEKKGCKGCHAKQDANYYDFKEENTLAWKHGVQKIQPFYGPTRGFSFIKEVQPILDANCVSCHDGSKEGVMSLNGDMKSHGSTEKRTFSDAYLNLTHAKKEERWGSQVFMGDPENPVVNWISKMSKPTELAPYSYGAATSKMMHLLEAGHYGVELSEEEFHKLYAWLDMLVPFVGEYREANDWSPEEMAYYNYYEYKRGAHYKEEVQHIKDWVASLDPKQPRAKAPMMAEKGYRMMQGTLSPTRNKAYKFTFAEDVMIDRLEVSLELAAKPSVYKLSANVSFSDGDGFMASLDREQRIQTIVLQKPKHSSYVRLHLNDRDVRVKGVKAFGVEMEELPNYEGHQPYLDLSQENL